MPTDPPSCPFCHGTGFCHRCQGTGFVRTRRSKQGECPECDGTGKCALCEGTGVRPEPGDAKGSPRKG